MDDLDGRSHGEPFPSAVGRVAFVLGFAGLMPQLAAVLLTGLGYGSGGVIALAYGALILSFLGGMWWGLAMPLRAGQSVLVGLAVIPSLVAGALTAAAVVDLPLALVGLGSAILLTLPVDRGLVTRGIAPANWINLRVPLSVGLGALTIVAGALAA